MTHRSEDVTGLYDLLTPDGGTFNTSMPVTQLLVPPNVEDVGGGVRFEGHGDQLVAQGIPNNLLQQFVNLRDDNEKAILKFAKKFGPLGIQWDRETAGWQVHGHALTRGYEVLIIEPIEAWRGWVSACRWLLRLISLVKDHGGSELTQADYARMEQQVGFPGFVRTDAFLREDARRAAEFVRRTKEVDFDRPIAGQRRRPQRLPEIRNSSELHKEHPTNWTWWKGLSSADRRAVAGVFVVNWLNVLIEECKVKPVLMFTRRTFDMDWGFGKATGGWALREPAPAAGPGPTPPSGVVTLLGVLAMHLVAAARRGRIVQCLGCGDWFEPTGKETKYCKKPTCGRAAANRDAQQKSRDMKKTERTTKTKRRSNK